MKRLALFLLIVGQGFLASAAAATFTLTPTVVGRFDDDFTPLPFEPLTGGAILSGAGYYQIDYSFTISDLDLHERGFVGTLFDLKLTGGLSHALDAGWTPYVDDPNDETFVAGGPRYAANVDAGIDSRDFQRVVAAIWPNLDSSDPRTKLGIDTPAMLGSVVLYWDGVTYSSLSTSEVTYAIADTSGGYGTVPGTAATAVIEFGVPAPGEERVLPQPAWTPPPPELPPLAVDPPPAPELPPPPELPPLAVDPPPTIDPPSVDLPPVANDPPASETPGIILLPGYGWEIGHSTYWVEERLRPDPAMPVDELNPVDSGTYLVRRLSDGTYIAALDGDATEPEMVLISTGAWSSSQPAHSLAGGANRLLLSAYGAAFDATSASPGVPEPASALLAAISLGVLALGRRRAAAC